VVRFADNGPGIDQEALGSVFEPFFTTNEPGTGTGPGLWICYQVVRKHGGTIHMTSETGQGTLVTLRLPSEVAPEPQAAGDASGGTEQAVGASRSSK
jgi:signal transduction histidine kinase